jgi:predicted DNA-binding transcriptional regulator AlpA
MQETRLLKARELEIHGIPRTMAYRLAKAGLIPSYKVGIKQHGVRFVLDEVLQALRVRGLASG